MLGAQGSGDEPYLLYGELTLAVAQQRRRDYLFALILVLEGESRRHRTPYLPPHLSFEPFLVGIEYC